METESINSIKRNYLCLSFCIFFFLLADIVLNALCEYSDEKIPLTIFAVIQFLFRAFVLLFFAIMLARTFLFRFGLLGSLCSRFKLTFLVLPLSLVLTLAFRLIRVVKGFGSKDIIEVWEDSSIQLFFVFHMIGSVFYYIVMLYTIYELSSHEYYIATPWVTRR
eukprot:TRINITY_DN1153_c0_g1_i1.p1 TRINITY_DN1153_c0_g1~~TRINITY_DN1153_c0_g1_i1.p1  ORF type:complete len:164 (-),score=13.21 TRINITY_DN1153_c0_g1_i1:226-717(-)